MDARKLLLALALGSLAMPAAAQLTEIFKCRDARGQWTYTNDRRQAEKEKCEQVTTQVNVAPPQKGARPSNFPRESSAERAAGKGRQREILQQELSSEEASLAKAKEELAEQESVRPATSATTRECSSGCNPSRTASKPTRRT